MKRKEKRKKKKEFHSDEIWNFSHCIELQLQGFSVYQGKGHQGLQWKRVSSTAPDQCKPTDSTTEMPKKFDRLAFAQL